MLVAASRDRTPGFERTLLSRAVDFFNDEVYELRDGEFIRIDAPTDANVSVHLDWLLIELRTDWYTGTGTYRAGSLIAADYDEFLAGTADLHVVFEPDDHTSLNHYAWTKDKLVIVTLADVASRVQDGDTRHLGLSRCPAFRTTSTRSSSTPTTSVTRSSWTSADSPHRRGFCTDPSRALSS